jgi:hypothetical protein
MAAVEAKMLGSCHCGNVRFSVSATPQWLTRCNCSICRRLGALWAHIPIDSVQLTCGPAGTIAYAQGDKTLAMHSCKHCGCSSHWENLIPDQHPDMAVNALLCPEEEIAHYRIRHFDGADTWTFID